MLCYDKTTNDIVVYVTAPYDVDGINKNIIKASGKVWKQPDSKVQIATDKIDAPFVEENTDKCLTVSMWSEKDKLSDDSFRDYFSNELAQLNLPIPESLKSILKP